MHPAAPPVAGIGGGTVVDVVVGTKDAGAGAVVATVVGGGGDVVDVVVEATAAVTGRGAVVAVVDRVAGATAWERTWWTGEAGDDAVTKPTVTPSKATTTTTMPAPTIRRDMSRSLR